MQFIDLKRQYQEIAKDVDQRIKGVLEHAKYLMGPEVAELEQKLAAYVGAKHCIGVASGSDALLIAQLALDMKAGDEIIVPAFSFIATASMSHLVGIVPVFVDIDPRTYNIDPAEIEAAITPRTKAIMPVDLYGQCADYDAIQTIAAKHKLAIITDAAQSFGATYQGRRAGGIGTIACTSFFPSKPLGTYGDGGALFTNDDELAKIIRQVHLHGQDGRYHHVRTGITGRLDSIQAAVLLAKFEIFDKEVELRHKVAARYNKALSDIAVVPYIKEGNTSVYAQYTIRVKNREAVMAALSEQGIPTAVHYPRALHQQPVFAHLPSANESFPASEKAAAEVLSLPFYPYLDEAMQDKIIGAIKELDCCYSN